MFLMSWSVSFSESCVSSRRDRLVGVLGAVRVLSVHKQKDTISKFFRLKGTGARDGIQIFSQKWTVLVNEVNVF